MAERVIRRRGSRLARSASAESAESSPEATIMGKSTKIRKPKKPKERWLLTRKTWRYMTDAGKKLIPDGAQNRPEDIPKIEAYFQEVCKREPKFLLWRKNSYPGALGFRKKRRERIKGGSCRKAGSADEVDIIKPERPKDLAIPLISGGRFDIQKMKYDFLNKPHSPSSTSPRSILKETSEKPHVDKEEEKQLVSMLEQYLQHTTPSAPSSTDTPKIDLNYQELIDKLQRHLTLAPRSERSTPTTPTPRAERVHFEGDHVQKTLSETLSRHFSQYPNRDKVISDLLTDRKALEKLYFELRKTKGFRGRVNERYTGQNQSWSPSLLRKYATPTDQESSGSKFTIPPPLIEIQSATIEIAYRSSGTQTLPIPEADLNKIEEEYKRALAEREEDANDLPKHTHNRRRSSVDNDDISQSVSDTIKRYLRMARKKSVDSDKVDRFKRVNYDRNLRNIKAKGETTKPGDDDGLNKGCQTNEDWITIYRDLEFDEVSEVAFSEPGSRVSSARSSIDIGVVEEKASPTTSGLISTGQSFLSHLLHGKHGHDKSGSSAAATTGSMQKSKSSSSVMPHGKQRLTKKIFKSRSKSQTRPAITTSNWTPQGSCVWNSVNGKQVVLNETNLTQLSDIERKVLQKVALAKIQALNLGVTVKPPTESVGVVNKPKRRPYLLKRKALTTGIFDTSRKDSEKDKEGSTSGGLVFGIPLSQCVENDRLSRLASGTSPFRGRGELAEHDPSRMGLRGSRASFSSLIDAARAEERGSCESLVGRERIAGSVPGLLDALSCGSTTDIAAVTAEEEPAVPNILNACMRHLEAHGLNTLGIFRVSTSKKRIRQLREDFDCGKETTLDEDQCPHDVATLIKEYLRELPDPLLCRDLYQAFVQTQRIRNRRLQLEALQHLIQLLPSVNRDTLYALLNFLATVAKHSNDYKNASGEEVTGNKMDSNNLATVFAPNILHCIKPGSKDNSGDRPEDRIDVINVIRTLIDHKNTLFTVPAEILDEVYVHMMDLHPEELNQLLSKKEANVTADESVDDLDSESNSAPWTAAPDHDHSLQTSLEFDGTYTPPQPRRTYSREEFLHESAATGGPNVAMRIRHKDKIRERSSRKKREESSSRKRNEDSGSSGSSLSAITIISKMRGQKEDDNHYGKMRSSSIESGSFHGDGSDVTRALRMNEDYQNMDRRRSSPYLVGNSGVITASLTIPVQTGTQGITALNVDDDIPYIEDGSGYTYTIDGKQQMTIGLIKSSPTAPPRRRQRSISGSDSSVASAVQPITGSISLGQQGYDSAMGSSATFSSPLHNTTPSSLTSSIADPSAYSSPPSWASSPPTSPDSQSTSVNYIPDEIPAVKTVKVIPIQKPVVKESPVLQKVTFTSTSELQQLQKAKTQEVKSYQRETSHTKTTTTSSSSSEIQKSVSSPAFSSEKGQEREQARFSPSITSIGNAVLRSRTADFERISSKPENKPASKQVPAATTTASSASDKKKYTKRRYTDSRHQTRHIPDAEALEAASNSNNAQVTNTDRNAPPSQSGPVYKRRELISSVPSK